MSLPEGPRPITRQQLLQEWADQDTALAEQLPSLDSAIEQSSSAIPTAGNELAGDQTTAEAAATAAQDEYTQYLTDLQTKAQEAKDAFDSATPATSIQSAIDNILPVNAPTVASTSLADIQAAFAALVFEINSKLGLPTVAAFEAIDDQVTNGAVDNLKDGGQKAAEALQLVTNFSPDVVDTAAEIFIKHGDIDGLL